MRDLIDTIQSMNANEQILRVALGIDWTNYRFADTPHERRRRAAQVRETIALIRKECAPKGTLSPRCSNFDAPRR